MTRRSIWTYPWPLRDRLVLAVVVAYFLVLLLTISNILPLRLYIQEQAKTSPTVSRALSSLEGVPYIGRVREVMRDRIKASDVEIVQKTVFLSSSYMIILTSYGLATIGVLGAYLTLGIGSDPLNELLQLNGTEKVHQLAIICLAFLGVFNSLLVFSSINGTRHLSGDGGGLPDDITWSNYSIGTTIMTSSLSLFLSLYMLRILLAWLYCGLALRRKMAS